MPRKTHAPGRDRRLRRRLFDAGNTMCPICLSDFSRADALAGTRVTLEHAPPRALGGSVVCLTCEDCNNRASLVDQHAVLSKKARDEWSAGHGAPIEVDLFGYKRTYRFMPRDSHAPYPARKHHLRAGTIELGALPVERMDADKGFGFKIRQRDDYEFVSMVKSAYLMVFSLMGANGYRFARNVGLTPVRQQIMSPGEKILKGGFVGSLHLDLAGKTDRSVVFLCRAEPVPFWIVPLWNDRAVFLSCGATEPIDELVFNERVVELPTDSLVGWVSRKFDGSSSIAGTLSEESDVAEGSLAGRLGGPFPTSQGGWAFISVFHQSNEFVALPVGPEGDLPRSGGIQVVEMLSELDVRGMNLDEGKLAKLNLGGWRDMVVTAGSASDE